MSSREESNRCGSRRRWDSCDEKKSKGDRDYHEHRETESVRRRWDSNFSKRTDSHPGTDTDKRHKDDSTRTAFDDSEHSSSSKTKRKSSDHLDLVEEKKARSSAVSCDIGKNLKKNTIPIAPIKMKMSTGPSSKKPAESTLPVKPKTSKLAQAFGDSDSEEEEIPPEARMRMKNVGRNTPTAAGPNSFGKGNLGFCDRQNIIKKQMEVIAAEVAKEDRLKSGNY